MKGQSAKDVSDFIEFIISENYLGVENGQFPIIYVSELGKDVLTGKIKVYPKSICCHRTNYNKTIHYSNNLEHFGCN